MVQYKKLDSNNIVMVYGSDFKKDSFLCWILMSLECLVHLRLLSNEYFNSLTMVTVTNRLDFIKVKQGISFEFNFECSLNRWILTLNLNAITSS